MTDTMGIQRSVSNDADQTDVDSLAAPSALGWRWTFIVWLGSALIAGSTVSGPGLTWDEPAYRHSQVTLQNWFREIAGAAGFTDRLDLFAKDSIERFWEYNRPGHNFHPPMGGYLNLVTYFVFGGWIDDISARRLASAFEFAGLVAILFHFLSRRYGWKIGLFAACTLLTLPRLMGHSHVIGTDMPLTFFWVLTALSFYRGIESRAWQWLFAVLWACLFLVKSTGAVIGAPLALWFLAAVLLRQRPSTVVRWFAWTLAMVIPLIPLAVTLCFGVQAEGVPAARRSMLEATADFGMRHGTLLACSYLWPMIVLLAFRVRRLRQYSDWHAGLELPWIAIAVTPLVCIAVNPTWWHEPVVALARYFELNLNRQEYLPKIGIYYLGQRYIFSLPRWNAFVLMAVTIPFGALVLGVIGTLRALVVVRTDRLPLYFLLHAMALPVLRMFPIPAHDGVRLFLPTFVFWSGLAAWGAAWVATVVARRGRKNGVDPSLLRTRNPIERAGWVLLYLIGPVWAGCQWARIHPFELSYYNVGLPRAVDWGFEATYWYDAVTPRALEEINRRLPKNVAVGLPDRLINPETFMSLKTLGRLRSDIQLDLHNSTGFPWMWLLTHSSKATPFTKLLYACPPYYAVYFDGVRLLSVVDPDSVALAWALRSLTVVRDKVALHDPRQPGPDPLVLDEEVFATAPGALRRAVELLRVHGANAPSNIAQEPPAVQRFVRQWVLNGQVHPNIDRLLRDSPGALDRAIDIIAARPEDIRFLLKTPGYYAPERFGGLLEQVKN